MSLCRGRIVRNGQVMTKLPVVCNRTQEPTERRSRGRIVRRERVEVAKQAEAMLIAARKRASELVRETEQHANQVRDNACKEGVDAGAAKLAAAWLLMNRNEARADEASLDRSVAIGRLLAERLIGESLRIHPELVAGMAREAMLHLWRSRTVTIYAHPEDVAVLEQQMATFGMPPERIVVAKDASRTRGSLRFSSDFGELDGDLGPQLDRFADTIRQELGMD